jgi:hypothetical protein
MWCRIAIQKVQQMRTIQAPVTRGRIFRRFDRQIGGATGRAHHRKRTRVQLIHKLISQGMIFYRWHRKHSGMQAT